MNLETQKMIEIYEPKMLNLKRDALNYIYSHPLLYFSFLIAATRRPVINITKRLIANRTIIVLICIVI